MIPAENIQKALECLEDARRSIREIIKRNGYPYIQVPPDIVFEDVANQRSLLVDNTSEEYKLLDNILLHIMAYGQK